MTIAPVHLLIIDPQNDFCDLPEAAGQQRPTLPVAGAHADMCRLAEWLSAHISHVNNITITLDSHQRFDIAHPGFWEQCDAPKASPVSPFTPITAAEVRSGNFMPRNRDTLPRVLTYLDSLEAQGRYTLMVWPEHCIVGSWGHGIHDDVLNACGQWQLHHQRAVEHVFKGLNPWTEHYSALQAEVVDPQDPHTQLNTTLLHRLNSAHKLLVAGEAGSHCVRSTVEHLLQHIDHPESVVLMTDCMSPVAGFESAQQDFLKAMSGRGVQLKKSSEIDL